MVRCVISWYLTGTLGYVMSEVEYGKPLSQVVNAAKSLGYTEPGDKLQPPYWCCKITIWVLNIWLTKTEVVVENMIIIYS